MNILAKRNGTLTIDEKYNLTSWVPSKQSTTFRGTFCVLDLLSMEKNIHQLKQLLSHYSNHQVPYVIDFKVQLGHTSTPRDELLCLPGLDGTK
eukprot:m.61485 g.61485  ORF g.61485 m.61485 type:complete len:93 (-) comp11418_c0_seq1:535-813(-)